MKLKALVGILAAALLASAACTSPGTANKATTNTTTTTTTNSSTTNRPTAPTNANAASNTSSTSNTSAPESAEGKQDFTLHNETGVEINALYVDPHSSNEWTEDILGRDTLPSGESVNITFSPKEKAAMWDLRVEDKGGNSITWENLNLLEIGEVTLYYKDGKATAEVK
jgi:hypothetical protein